MSVKSDALVKLTCLLYDRLRWPRPTEVVPMSTSLYFTHGSHRYWITPDVSVLEVADGRVFESIHSRYVQGILRGGKRDASGALIFDEDMNKKTATTIDPVS